MYLNLRARGYKLCKWCYCPMLKKGQKRKHHDAYRHAQGCKLAPASERRTWKKLQESTDADE